MSRRRHPLIFAIGVKSSIPSAPAPIAKLSKMARQLGDGRSSSHYELLGVGRNCSQEELRAAYQRLVLQLHPDKAGLDSHDSFQALQQAWQTLREPHSRALYDHQLSQAELRATVVLHDEVELSDMQQAASGADEAGAGTAAAGCSYSYPCRCGDSYVLRPADTRLALQQVVIPCRSCSNHILVTLPT